MTRNLPLLIQLVGLLVIVAAAMYWVATSTQSVLFVLAGMVLVALGAYMQMSLALHRSLTTADREPSVQ